MADSRHNEKNITVYGAGAALFVAILGIAYFARPFSQPMADDPVASREVVGYSVIPGGAGEDTVKYQYQGKPLPEKIVPDESVAKRTENSYTRDLGVENAGTKQERHKYQSIFYAEPAFVEDGGAWYYRETATTTKSAFDAMRRDRPRVAAFLIPTAYAASIAPFSGSGDGYLSSNDGEFEIPAVFSNCSNGTGSGGVTPVAGGTVAAVQSIIHGPLASRICEADRTYLPFDTSAMPGNAVVSAATLNVYVTSKANGVDDGDDTINMTRMFQSSNTTLFDTDWGTGYETGGATALDITSMTTSAYNVFTLNATGRSWVKGSGQTSACGATAGWTCLGLVEGHDINGSMTVNNTGDGITLSTSENTGTSQDPHLDVTYSASSFAFWQFQDY